MILNRFGNKKKVANKIIDLFPDHNLYVEPFFGAGGLFFNKPLANYNIVNDIDSDVFNLYQVVINQKEELVKQIELMPIHSDLLEYWKKNKESKPIKKAIRFLLLSNFTYMGIGGEIHSAIKNYKLNILNVINTTNKLLQNVIFQNKDFRKFIKGLSFRGLQEIENTLIYCDPPYLGTIDNYSNSFTEQDTVDLLNELEKTGCKYAVSEFDNDFILNIVKGRNLNVHFLGERQNLKNRRTEILVTNYKIENKLF